MPEFRIFVDESGTHSDEYLIIGMLFVPNHGALHSDLLAVKRDLGYLNESPKRKAEYKETHLTGFRSQRDVEVAKQWIDLFVAHDCWFRSLVFDWSMWQGKYFGDPFEPDALKKRRAYKKWAELLLQPEFSTPLPGRTQIRGARLFLDRLRIMYGYDILDHLESRFTGNYRGNNPYISEYQHTPSWKDANQALQLCDVLVGCLFQSVVPSSSEYKLATRDHLAERLTNHGVDRFDAGFWRQWHPSTMREHLPKYSAWFWLPEDRR